MFALFPSPIARMKGTLIILISFSAILISFLWLSRHPSIHTIIPESRGIEIVERDGNNTIVISLDMTHVRPYVLGEHAKERDEWILNDLYGIIAREEYKPTIAINGTFFRDVEKLSNGNSSRLAFPLAHASLKSGYSGNDEGYHLKYVWYQSGSIFLSDDKPEQEVEFLITGLSPLSNKDGIGTSRVGRTYLGIKDEHTLLVLVGKHLSEEEAVTLLEKNGSHSSLMLDGGPSSSLWVENTMIIQNRALIAHGIGFSGREK